MSMGCICVFAKLDEPDVSRIEYSKNWKNKLNDINSNFYSDLYSCYAIYETDNSNACSLLFNDVFESIKPGLRVDPDKGFIKLSPKQVYRVLKAFAKITKTEKNLVLQPNIENKDSTHKSSFDTSKNYIPDKIGKDKTLEIAQKYAKEHNIKLCDKITYAAKNGGHDNYWANTVIRTFHDEWNIVFEDYVNRKIYLFYIPKDALKPEQFRVRTDEKKKGVVNIVIRYNDPNFSIIDGPDKSFGLRQFLIAEIGYEVDAKPDISEDKIPEASIEEIPFKTYNLTAKNPDVLKAKPCQITFDGIDYTVNTYQDMVEMTLEFCLLIDEEKIYSLAKSNSSFLPTGKKVFLSTDPSILPRPAKVNGYGIYFDTIMNSSEAIKFVQWLADEVGIDPRSYSYTIYKKIEK